MFSWYTHHVVMVPQCMQSMCCNTGTSDTSCQYTGTSDTSYQYTGSSDTSCQYTVRNSLCFRCKNIFVRRKCMKIFYTNIILQLKFLQRIIRTLRTYSRCTAWHIAYCVAPHVSYDRVSCCMTLISVAVHSLVFEANQWAA